MATSPTLSDGAAMAPLGAAQEAGDDDRSGFARARPADPDGKSARGRLNPTCESSDFDDGPGVDRSDEEQVASMDGLPNPEPTS